MAGRRRTSLDGRVDVLLAALGEYGMSASAMSAAELIQERVGWVAAQMRVTPATARRYLTDEAVRDLARMMAVAVADEAPGADVLASPRTAAVPVPVLGRCIAGVAEAIVLRLAERDDLGHVRATTAQLAQALSALGQVIAGQHTTSDTVTGTTGPDVPLPPALLNRVARYLEAAAALVRTEGLLPGGFEPATQLSSPAPSRPTPWPHATTLTARSPAHNYLRLPCKRVPSPDPSWRLTVPRGAPTRRLAAFASDPAMWRVAAALREHGSATAR